MRCLANTWTDEEERIFIEKLADFASRPEKDGLKKNFRECSLGQAGTKVVKDTQ